MPVGIMINSVAIVCGGILGTLLSKFIPERLKRFLPDAFALSAIFMGIVLMINVKQLAMVVLALIMGTLIGELFCLEKNLSRGLNDLGRKLPGIFKGDNFDDLISLIVLLCFSGTGVFGAMNEAITGDHTILLSKSILDFFTALLFGTTLGYGVAAVAIPQFIVGVSLFACSSCILPLVSPIMLADFKACGGVITLAAGIKIAKIKEFHVFNMLPSLLLIFLFLQPI